MGIQEVYGLHVEEFLTNISGISSIFLCSFRDTYEHEDVFRVIVIVRIIPFKRGGFVKGTCNACSAYSVQ